MKLKCDVFARRPETTEESSRLENNRGNLPEDSSDQQPNQKHPADELVINGIEKHALPCLDALKVQLSLQR